MKIIHCADLHLDSTLSSNYTREQAKERKNELLMTFIRMTEYAEENQVRIILISGDLFDKKVISARARNTVYETIKKHSDIDFYYLQGNHDVSTFIDQIGELPSNLFLFSEEWRTYDVFCAEDRKVTISGVELSKLNSNTIYASLVLRPQDLNIVMMHGQTREYTSKNKAEEIDLGKLKNKNISYLALGHVHEYLEGVLPPAGHYCYSGCLEGRGFDEDGEHGFVLLTIDEDTFELKREFIPFAFRQIHVVEVDVTDCTTAVEMIERVKTITDKEKWKNDLVKICLCGNVDVGCEKNTGLMEQYFADCFYYIKVKDQTQMRIDYKEYRNDKSLKGEFVRMLEASTDISEEERMDILRCGLQVLRGEAIEL